MKPIIAVGPHFILNPEKKQVIGAYQNYLDAVASAQGQPIVLTPMFKDIAKAAKMFDGLLLQGGGDIHPKYFNDRIPKNVKLSLSPNTRTEYDLALIEAFLKLKKPILGICLGSQTLNVFLGGGIIQDIPTQCPHARDHKKGRHPTYIRKDTQLGKIIGSTKITTNSHHHQSMGALGKDLIISAQSDDGIVEAIESTKYPFALGIQWHPEKDASNIVSKKIFKALVQAC